MMGKDFLNIALHAVELCIGKITGCAQIAGKKSILTKMIMTVL